MNANRAEKKKERKGNFLLEKRGDKKGKERTVSRSRMPKNEEKKEGGKYVSRKGEKKEKKEGS